MLMVRALFVVALGGFVHINTQAQEMKASCQRSLKIGVSLPLSGGAQSSGEAVKNSIILADQTHDINKCVQFIFEDDQLLAKNTRTIVNKFIKIDRVDGVIVYGTPISLAVGDSIERSKTPMIALSILGEVVRGRTHIMKHWCTAERLHHAVSLEVRQRGYRSIAIVSTQNDAMLAIRDLFVQSKTARIASDDEFVRDNFDYRSSIAKIIRNKVDAVYVLLYPPQPGVFMKQLRQQGFTGEAFGVHNIEGPHEVQSSGTAMLGMWLANGDETAGSENYRSAYKERFGRDTAVGAASGFDSAKMFIEASQHAGDVNNFLHGLRGFQGAFGTYSATPENDFDFGAVIKVVERDGFRKVLN